MLNITTAGVAGTVAVAVAIAIFLPCLLKSIRTLGPLGLVARVAAIGLTAASAALSTHYAFHFFGQFGLVSAVAMAVAVSCGEIFKPLAVEQAFAAGFNRPALMVRAGVLALVCVAYSLAAEIAVSHTSRSDQAAQRTAEAAQAKDARAAAAARDARRQRAEAELATLAKAYPADRAVDVVQPLVDRAREVCRREVVVNARGRHTAEHCAKPVKLTDELARAKRRAELEGIVAGSLQPVAAAASSVARQADPQAAAVVHYLRAAGRDVTEADVAPWLSLLPVLLLEIGSALGWSVAVALGRVRVPESVAAVAATDSAAETVATVAAEIPAPARVPAIVLPAESVPVAGKRLGAMVRRIPAPVPANVRATVASTHPVLAAIERAGRPLSVSELAGAMQVCRGEASKRWREVAGQVRVQRRGKFTMVGLAVN